ISPGKIESSSPDQVFQDFSIDRLGIQTTAIVLDRVERTVLLAFRDRGFHGGFADVFDGGESVSNTSPLCLNFRHELQITPVDVGWQNRYSEPLAFRDEDSNFFRVVDFVTEQSGHEFNRIV